MDARTLLDEAADECGWTEPTQIEVLCQFIDQKEQPDFKTFLRERVDEEFSYEEEDDENPEEEE